MCHNTRVYLFGPNIRFHSKHPQFDKWETLEALQSLLLYVLMRVTEGRHDYTNFDTQLLGSVYVSIST